MEFHQAFPLRYWINLARRNDRRAEMEWRLAQVGVEAERFPAVDARFVKNMALQRRAASLRALGPAEDGANGESKPQRPSHIVRGYSSAGRYALALAQRMAIRQARLRKAPAVLLLEDDAILHPNFQSLVQVIDLPEDWGIFYFGCAHLAEPTPVSPGIVRVRHAVDTHAVAIRDRYYDLVIQALDAHGKPTPRHPLASDRFLAALQSKVPTYACFPNLAWQAQEQSDLLHITYSNYHSGGTQKQGQHYIERTFKKLTGAAITDPKKVVPKLGLLFLTRGDVNHPEIWKEFIDECPEQVRVFSHPKVRDQLEGSFVEGTTIEDHHDTEWGSISLVKATLALLRAALEDKTLTHFVLLSESCVPIRPLGQILRHLRLNPRSRFSWRKLEDSNPLQQARALSLPQIPQACWRFQSQWWMLDRMTAEWVARADYTDVFAGIEIPDEAYFATVLCLLGYPLEDRVVRNEVTWTHWQGNEGSPTSIESVDSSMATQMVESSAWFARKFPPASNIAEWGLHRSAVVQ